MSRLRNRAMRDYQKSVTTGQTDTHTHKYGQTDTGQSDPYVPLCFACDTKKYKNGNSARRTSKQRHIRLPIPYSGSDNFSSEISVLQKTSTSNIIFLRTADRISFILLAL